MDSNTTNNDRHSTYAQLSESLGKNIRTLREDLDLNQNEFGNKFGLSRVSISNIEKGKQRPPLQLIFDIVKEFSISYDDILPDPRYSKFGLEHISYSSSKSVTYDLINRVKNSINTGQA